MWRTLKLVLLLVMCLTPISFSKKSKKKKNKKWKDYRRFWCTDPGRELITRGTTAEECRSSCGDGCEAVEWWENGKNACYICKDLKLLAEFPKRLKNDQSFPPHVFVKRIPGKLLPRKSDLMTTAKPFTATTQETPTSSSYNEGTTISTKPEFASPSNSQQTTTSVIQDQTTLPTKEVRTTKSPEKDGTTAQPGEDKGEEESTTTSIKEDGTTASSERAATAFGDEGTTTSPEEGVTTPPEEELITKSSEEEGTTTSSKEVSATTSSEKEGTITSPEEEATTSPEEEGTTTSSEEVNATTSSSEEGTTTSPEEEGTTTSSSDEATTSLRDVSVTTSSFEERTTSSTEEEGTTSSPEEVSETTSPKEEGTTQSPGEEQSTTSSEKVSPTTSPEEEGTTSPGEEEEATTSPKGERTTQSPGEEQSTTSPEEVSATTSPEEGTTSPGEEEATTSPEEEGTTPSPVEEQSTTSPEEVSATTSPEEEGTTSPGEEEATTSPEEEGTTPSPVEEQSTTSPVVDEGATTSPEDVSATTSPEEEGTTPSPGEEQSTTSPEMDEGATTSPEEVSATTSPEEEGTAISPKKEGTTTSPEEAGNTSSAPTSPAVEATFPDTPRNVKANALSETEIEVTWDSPIRKGHGLYYEVRVTEVTEDVGVTTERLIRVIRMPGTNPSFVIRSLSPESQYIISVSAGNDYGPSGWSDLIYSETPKVIKARTETADCSGKNDTTKGGEMPSCVNVEKDDQIYTVNASYGRWPDDGFCRTLVDSADVSALDQIDAYKISADLYVPEVKGFSDDVYLGVFFNAKDENNFDFVSFRFGSRDNSCFQTGTARFGQINWFGSQSGSCPFGPPAKERWTRTALEIRDSEVTVFLDDAYITSFKAHLPLKAAGGVAVANNYGNVIRFKDFSITDLPLLPFTDKSCASLQDHKEYYSVISQSDHWFQGFCRVLAKDAIGQDSLMENETSYQISVDLFSEVDWSGDRLAYVGIIFNARDINNADFIYFRPFWKDHCYQTGYLLAGYQMRESSKTGPCSCAVKGGKWFNVRLEIRRNMVTVIMNDIPTTTFKSHYSAINKGSGVLVTGGRRMAIRFRNLFTWRLPQLPFDSKHCQSTRVNEMLSGDVFTLMAYSGLEDLEHSRICRALFPKVIAADSYVVSVKIQAKGSLMGGKYGIIFNVKNADSFDFVSFRPYHRSSCVEAGHVKVNNVKEYYAIKSSSCSYGILKSGRWYDVRVKVSGSDVKVLVNDVEVAGFTSHSEVNGRGGVMVASGFRRKISFKNFRVLN